MSSEMANNRDVACFYVTKVSWKGRYQRIFAVGTLGIRTCNLSTMDVTNQWHYSELLSILPKAGQEFAIAFRKGRKGENTMRFVSEHRADIITQTLKFRHLFADPGPECTRYRASKQHWSEQEVPVELEVGPLGLTQLGPGGRQLCTYAYRDVGGLAALSDKAGGLVVATGSTDRLHVFVVERREELMKKVVDHASQNLGLQISFREPLSLSAALEARLGRYSSDDAITSLCEFVVHKISHRHREPVKRLLCLTESCLLERDPASYAVVTLRPLGDVCRIVRSRDHLQQFSVEYVQGQVRCYSSSDRDALLATLMDGVRASGNVDVYVSQWEEQPGLRVGPRGAPPEEDVEAAHLRFLHSRPPNMNWSITELLSRFNTNVPYSGLLHATSKEGFFSESKDKQVQQALCAVLEAPVDTAALESQFQALRRLVASRPGFAAFTQLARVRERLGTLVVRALKRDDPAVTHAAVDMLCALMQPMHDHGDLHQEQLNKASLLSSKSFLESLMETMVTHVERGTGTLVVSAMLDLLTFALCHPYSETTEGAQFDSLLELVASHGRIMFQLFQHPSVAIVKGAGMVMRAIIEEGDAETSRRMQELALAEAALARHLQGALFGGAGDSRLLALRHLSRHLVGLWVTGHEAAMGALKRMLPPGLLTFLEDPEKPPQPQDAPAVRDNLRLANEHPSSQAPSRALQQWKLVERRVDRFLQHWRQQGSRTEEKQPRPIVLRKRRQRVKSDVNWPMFYYQFNQDHARPDLIWNFRTREELRNALETELKDFVEARSLCQGLPCSWNHKEFEVIYKSLADEVRVGDYFLRLLLEQEHDVQGAPACYIRRSCEFFNDLYHTFLLATQVERRCQCLQAMALVYGRHYNDIGPFNDTRHILAKLEKCRDRLERDRLVLFLSKLILHKRNVKDLLDANGISTLVDLVTLAHLHTGRALVPTQMNVIEASPEMMVASEKEWHVGGDKGDYKEPFSYAELKEQWAEGKLTERTKVWAVGMDGWRPLASVAQLRWGLAATGTPLLHEGDLASTVLSMLNTICSYYPSMDPDGAVVRPLPRAKRKLSDRSNLIHIVQVLLTFDPVLVEKVAHLLLQVMEHNPAVQQLYSTGFFFFVLLYTGSNLLGIGELLHSSHTCQAFRLEEGSTLTQRSILGQILPEAMVCYLENHGAAKFAEIFLGEFDTPEAIWNAEMRRFMMEKIANHLGDFTPRLKSNTRTPYQYCPIPPIRYPQLRQELFCNIYYLRHLCDTVRFPDWPIADPVALLRDVLQRWREELDRKPPSLSVEDACRTLGLGPQDRSDDTKIRHSYFKLAQKYHPDKNPDGREMFEKVNKAYEFLADKSERRSEGPDPVNLQLILKTQAILFSRHKQELEPYKYAGYGLLIQTMASEVEDPQLLSKTTPLLGVAIETALHTLRCSPLNVEELRREGGLQVLEKALSRSVEILNQSSRADSLETQVLVHTASCFAVAAQFPACRQALSAMPGLARDLCRGLYFQHLPDLCLSLVGCVAALAVDSTLQSQLFEAGVLYHLLGFTFKYDYTLREGGVESSASSNQQEVANQLAEQSVVACGRLGGLCGDCPPQEGVRRALSSLLTPYLARKLALLPPEELLRVVTGNTRSPYLIWDNGTRAELADFLSEQRRSMVRSGEGDPSFGADFVFSAHQKELVIGEVFVRIYNEQPAFPLENPRQLCLDLLDFVGSQAQYLHSARALSTEDGTAPQAKRFAQSQMALEALHNVLRNHPGLEPLCMGHFRLLFCLLSLDGCGSLQRVTVQVIQVLTGNQECVQDIANSDVLVYLLLVLMTFEDHEWQLTVLETLLPLMSNSKLVKEAINKGGVLYLLEQWCNSSQGPLRERTADLLSKMAGDKLHGAHLRRFLDRFLPPVFLDAMRQSPQEALHLFQGNQENPELIWNEECRKRLCETVHRMSHEQLQLQKQNPNTPCKLPAEFTLVECDPKELMVAGVYVRLFIHNTSWSLRRPVEFLTECLDRLCTLLDKDQPQESQTEPLCQAVCGLLQRQGALRDRLPIMGHLPQLAKAMGRPPAAPWCLRLLHEAAFSQVCAEALVQTQCLESLSLVLGCDNPEVTPLACQMVHTLLQRHCPALVHQALSTGLVERLLWLLEQPSTGPTSKAHIVQALKAMAGDPATGDQVSLFLSRSKVWSDYKEQKHDLFVTATPNQGVLPSSTGIAGYLTQGRHLPQSPPPLRDNS